MGASEERVYRTLPKEMEQLDEEESTELGLPERRAAAERHERPGCQ
jgi:hypothetical protein